MRVNPYCYWCGKDPCEGHQATYFPAHGQPEDNDVIVGGKVRTDYEIIEVYGRRGVKLQGVTYQEMHNVHMRRRT